MTYLISPYESTVNVGLISHVSNILQLRADENQALIDLLNELQTIGSDETFNDIFNFVLIRYKEVDPRRLFNAYEAIYQIHAAKLALGTSLKEGNAGAALKKALEDLEAFASQIPAQVPDESLTLQQKEKLTEYLGMLESYYKMYDEEESNNPTDSVD